MHTNLARNAWNAAESVHRASKAACKPVPVAALVLHSDPQLVHFCEVDQQEVHCI